MRGNRQHQGVEPQENASGQAGEHAATVGLLPIQRAKHGRGELGHSGKGDLADGRQASGGPQQAVADIGQQQDHHDGYPAYRKHPVAERFERPLGVVAAQQPGQQHVVGHHGRQRHGLDDHHAGGRRGTADERQQGKARVRLGQRQADDERVGDHRAGQQHLPGQGNRHHEQRGQCQVHREYPARQAQVLRFDVLDHGNVELPGQADDCHHRHGGLHHHGRPIDGFFPIVLQVDRLAGLAEQVVETVIQVENDEDAHGKERQQLDQRFEGDRQDHAAVVLGHIQAAGTEDDREQRQYQRYHQRGVLHAGAGGVGVGPDQQVHAQYDALELQGDIRQHADQADQRHHHCQGLRLAVACGNEVGDRGDVLLLADQHHLLQHPRREDQQQYRAQVDGQECPKLFGGLADRAEEGPAGAVHGQRQAVHPGTQLWRQWRAAAVAIEGDGEHDGHIGQGDHGDQPAGQRHEDSEAKR